MKHSSNTTTPSILLSSQVHRRRMAGWFSVIDDFAKEYLHNDLRDAREVMLWTLHGLSEYDIRRPLTATGTNLLGLVKHLTHTESRYLGEVFDRPYPRPIAKSFDHAGVGSGKAASMGRIRFRSAAMRALRSWRGSGGL